MPIETTALLQMTIVDPQRLLEHLCAQSREAEWFEFKVNRFDPNEVGEYISALANSAMLEEQDRAYLVFGVDDETHEIVGTNVDLRGRKIGGQLFEQWLSRLVEPRLNLEFVSFDVDGRLVEMIVIDPSYIRPVLFKSEAYIRVSSVQQKLRDFPERERSLWAITSRFSFEQGIAANHLSPEGVLELFDCRSLLRRIGPDVTSVGGIIDRLLIENLIVDDRQGGFDAINLLAIIAARDIRQFNLIAEKAPRVITYSSESKLKGVDDATGQLGYGAAFPRLLRYIMTRLPQREEIRHGVRGTKYGFPEIAVRELVANALIHQDLSSSGECPRIELFPDKIKITSPGRPLVSPERFIDAPAKSRNEKLAGMMRRLGYCES